MSNCNSVVPNKKSHKSCKRASLASKDSGVTDRSKYKSTASVNNPDTEMQDRNN